MKKNSVPILLTLVASLARDVKMVENEAEHLVVHQLRDSVMPNLQAATGWEAP